MSDERRQRLLNQYEDAALQLLMDEYAEAEGKLLLEEYEAAEKRGEVGEIPNELDQKCKQIIHKSFTAMRRKGRLFTAGRLLSKAAVFLLVLIGLSATLVLSVEAFRIPILNYLIRNDVRFSTLLFLDENVSYEDPLWESIYIEDCVPREYSLEYKQETPDGGNSYVFFDDKGNMITVEITPSYGMLNFDTENADQELLDINGYDAIWINGVGHRVLWLNPESNLVYDVSSDGLSEAEFWKVVYRLASSE